MRRQGQEGQMSSFLFYRKVAGGQEYASFYSIKGGAS